jgi:PAS domain S-box-containing protein
VVRPDPARSETRTDPDIPELPPVRDGGPPPQVAPPPIRLDPVKRNFPRRPLFLAALLFLLLCLAHPLTWHSPESAWLYFAPAGLSVVALAWLGWPALALVAAAYVLCATLALLTGMPNLSPRRVAWHLTLDLAEVALGWMAYRRLVREPRHLEDPRSATLFLLVIPGFSCAAFALLRYLTFPGPGEGLAETLRLAASGWFGHALGILAVAPPLLIVFSAWLVYHGWIRPEGRESPLLPPDSFYWSRGEAVEIGGLALATAVLGLMWDGLHRRGEAVSWFLWVLPLLLVVWASLRQGLRGGSIVAGVASLFALFAVQPKGMPSQEGWSPYQGNLMAQCCTALLVGASSAWIRASEARYRRVVGHVPVVLYTARLLRPGRKGVPPLVQMTFVSSASQPLLGAPPDDLLGDAASLWLERVHPDDREVVLAAWEELWRNQKGVTCEYRLAEDSPERQTAGGRRIPARPRWARDTLIPHFGADGKLDGWEGVLEDVTDGRALAHDLRHSTSMLNALIANLPAGVFFVEGEKGQPMLVNARARQLLGRREDPSAGPEQFPEVYHLLRPDGSPYQAEDLPVFKALRYGSAGMRDDILVRRPDGQRVPLVTWAASVDLGGQRKAAVWVLEDLTQLRTAEAALRESEGRLRAIIETMAEGLLTQDGRGVVLECNPAACSLLGQTPQLLCGRASPWPGGECRRPDGTPLPTEEYPDRVCLRTNQPVREMRVGIPAGDGVRWLVVNVRPLEAPPGAPRGRGRIVTTFTEAPR